MSNTVLITGAAGFAGSHLIDRLAGSVEPVVAWRHPGGRPPHIARGVSWEDVDLLDFRSVLRSIDRARPAHVYHCAGAAHVGRSWNDTESTFAVNVRGTHHLLEALSRTDLNTRVVIPSSAMVYQPASRPLREDDALGPLTPYGLSKLAQEMLGQRAVTPRLAVMIGRAFNHVGPRQDSSFSASGFARQIAEIEHGLREPEIVVGNLSAQRDVLDVRDTVKAYQAILEHGQAGRVYNICSGRAVETGDILDMLKERSKVPMRVRVDPNRFRPSDTPTIVGDSSRLRSELAWAPTIPLSRTLEDLLDYWRFAVAPLAGETRVTPTEQRP